MAISLAMGTVGGYLLDRKLGTGVFFWIGLIVGVLAAYRSLWVIYDRYLREKEPH
jgi:F0F1-type ATP synthase assembly protein I